MQEAYTLIFDVFSQLLSSKSVENGAELVLILELFKNATGQNGCKSKNIYLTNIT